ncbi:MAG: recombinase family protein [Candidatus Izemoplasmatales bacterium]
MNEWYARDISIKIRTAYKTKAINGEFTGAFSPYGYSKDPNNKNKLILNLEQSKVVQKIFSLYNEGFTVYKISRYLKTSQIPTPKAETYVNHKKYHTENPVKYPYDWMGRTILTILSNEEYLGNLVCNKQSTKSYKDKRLKQNPKEEWIITSNAHEPIVEIGTFNKAKKNMAFRTKKKVIKNEHLFIGKIKCDNCGKTLTYSIDKRKNDRGIYVCSTYRVFGKERCSSHYLRYGIVCEYVYASIKMLKNKAEKDESKLCDMIYSTKIETMQTEQDTKRKTIEEKKRFDDIETIFKKLYEDYALKRITIEDYDGLKQNFEKEKSEIQKRIDDYADEFENSRKVREKIRDFVSTIKK